MTVLERRRDRLVHVLDLARMYRGWTRQEVAAALGREPSKMIPESGNPKLDLVMGIARLLEWPVGEVAECLWGDRLLVDAAPEADPLRAPSDAERAAALRADAASQRREGRFQQAIDRLQQALILHSVPALERARIQLDLAELHGTLWHLAESRALASELLRTLERGSAAPTMADGDAAWGTGSAAPGTSDELERRRLVVAAHAARGHALRRSIATDPAQSQAHAAAALEDLIVAECGARESGMLALAHRARGAILECRVELGRVAPDDAVEQTLAHLDQVVDLDSVADELLEGWGWWCIFGANIVARHLRGESAQRALGVFANKAMEIAERIGDWALRERAFALDHARRQDDGSDPGADAVRLLDHDDVRSIIGTMGRFPHFRETGWSLLRRAVVVE